MSTSIKLRKDTEFMLEQLTTNKNGFINDLIAEKFMSLPMPENEYTRAFIKYKDGMDVQHNFDTAIEYYISVGIIIKHFEKLSVDLNPVMATRLLNNCLENTSSEKIISLFTNWCFKAGLSKELYIDRNDTNLLAMIYGGITEDDEPEKEIIKTAILTGYIYGEGICIRNK